MDEADLAVAVEWMVRLNKHASRAARKAAVKGATDITGYSLLGHATEMANASKVKLQFELSRIPVLPEAQNYAAQNIFPGGAYDNRHHFEPLVQFDCPISDSQRMLLFDPQTSGGLLLAVPVENAQVFETEMKQQNQEFWQVGSVVTGSGIQIF